MKLEGKTVLITGGGGGIGGGMAQAFAERGARIILADINPGHAEEEGAKLPGGTDVQILKLDVRDLESWSAARENIERRHGTLDILCNNAGISSGFKPLLDVIPDEFASVMSINVTGVYNGIRTFAPGMVERGSGHIVNTSSMNGLNPFGTFAAYSASKFAVLGMSDAVRQELAPFGVGVSTLFPGLTRSRMAETDALRAAGDDAERRAAIDANMMDPVWLGRAVVRAVENGEPYIVTHPEYKAGTRARFEEILAAFGDPAQPGYKTGETATRPQE